VIEDVTDGLDVYAHTVFVISQSHSTNVRVKMAVSSAQSVQLRTRALRGPFSVMVELAKLEIYDFKQSALN